VLLTLAVGQFLAVGSASIVSVALPTIARDLGAIGEQQQWIVDAYVLVFASLLPAARARAIGLWSTAPGLGLALGPVIGGGLVDAVGWREAFARGLHHATIVSAGLLALGFVLALALVPTTGSEAP
jgi:MFS family permease